MEKEKVLEIEFKELWDNNFAWKIVKQNEEILKRNEFIDKELNVESFRLPEFLSLKNKLYIRGSEKSRDNDIQICTSEEKALIEEKVKAVNEKYGITKRWRANKYAHYHFLGNVFEIQESVEMGFVEDIERYRDGNYFRTKEEAEEYAKYIKKCSLEWHKMRENNE